MKGYIYAGRRRLLLVMALLLVLSQVYSAAAYGGEEQVVYKTFGQMSRDEKERALNLLKENGTVPLSIRVGGGSYQLNQELWYQKGIIVYGNTANINAAVQTTASPNYKDGKYRYWGYDVNGGLYGNDDFPRDSDSGIQPWKKHWLTIGEIRASSTAKGYVGQFAMNADFAGDLKWATAYAFLKQNPAFRVAGMDEQYLLDHFYFNAVVSESGLTQGQFVGVHLSRFDNRLYYQTFSVSVETRLFQVPPPEPVPIVLDPPLVDDPAPLPEPGVLAEAACALALPAYTYEGHPALAEDVSLFYVGGETWSARRAYEGNLADNRFSLVAGGSPAGNPSGSPDGGTPGRLTRLSSTRAEAIFDDVGHYQVELAVTPAGGSTQYDIKPISVLRTPTILHSLTGTQKQNRKQVLNLQVATHPDYPLVELRVELMRPATGEKVTLIHQLDKGEQNQNENGETIKTRPIKPLPSDSLFRCCMLEFLTKNPTHANYRYAIYVKDSRGHEDQVSVDFSVAKDLPPVAAVEMESLFIRGENSNLAEIIAIDGTSTDGDQIKRTWYYQNQDQGEGLDQGETGTPGESGSQSPAPGMFSGWIPIPATAGYQDLSFGTGKKIGFAKEGVGRFRVGLMALEIWSEETLPEYVSPEDHLTSAAIGEAEVINIAPVVSLSPIRRTSMDITILAGGTTEYEHAKANRGLLAQSLLAGGIDGKVRIEKMNPVASAPEANPAKAVMEVNTPFGHEGGWTFYENGNYIVDEEQLYKIDATWISPNAGVYPQSPYTISAWEARSGRPVWTYSFTDTLMAVPVNGPYFAQDSDGRFLFFNAGGRTLILSKDTGSFLTVLDFETGTNVCVGKDSIYCIKSDGIYRIKMQTGEIKKINSGRSSGETRIIGGKIHFLSISGTTLYRGIFDPDTETVSLERLLDGQTNSGLSSFRAIGIDTAGKIIVNSLTPAGSSSYISETRVYGRDNRMIRTVSMQDTYSYTYTVTPVYDAGGKCNYIVYTFDSRGSGYYGNAKLFGIYNDYSGTVYVSDSNGYPTETSQVIFARELSGKVYVATGAYWTYILYTNSYNNGPTHGLPERVKVFVFEPATGYAGTGTLSQLGIGLSTREYGRASDSLAAVQTGNNHIGLSYGSETVVTTWSQSLSDILGRYLGRTLPGEKEISTLILYDETNPKVLYDTALLGWFQSRLEAGNSRLIMANPALIEDSSGLARAITGMAEEGSNALGVQVEPGMTGSIRKTYELLPDTAYYYEYESKRADAKALDSLNLALDMQGIPGVSTGTSGYRTVSSYFEDFNDADTEPFFQLEPTRLSGGVYMGGNVYNYQGKKWKNRYYADGSSMTFTVPEGYQAVLSFDWETYTDASRLWMASFIQVNGVPWHEFTPNYSERGSYCHPFLLPSGQNTLEFFARAYGGRETIAKMWIDNLRVDLVKSDPAGGSGSKETLGIESLTDGYSRITGSFRTPLPAGGYREITEAEVIKGSIGTAPYTGKGTWEAGDRQAIYNIPTGKTAIFTLISTASWPNNYTGNANNARYIWNGYTWDCTAQFEWPEDARIYIPSNYKIPLPAMSGTQTVQASAASYRGADATINGIDSVVVDSLKSFLKDRNYFIADQGSGAAAFLEADLFQNRGTVTIDFPEGSSLIRNLKIYTYQKGAKVYVTKEAFSDPSGLAAWQQQGAAMAIQRNPASEKEEDVSIVYKKGETVDYSIYYSDYEGDPSKKQDWRYTHTPGNDGPHPLAAVILDEQNQVVAVREITLPLPLRTFRIDGKYTVEHWQEDNTARPPTPGGNPAYDKHSNIETITFYVEGGAAGPWIESIRTIPPAVKEGRDYEIEVRVNDAEKDVLRLRTEVYQDRQLIYSHNETGIIADNNGRYPPVVIPSEVSARAGSYEVVCTVRDQSGMGMGSYRFMVLSSGKITGSVYHTALWEGNRKKYNLFYFKEEFNQKASLTEYLAAKPPRRRGTNVFWPGERFLLSASLAGEPRSVSVSILGSEKDQTVLMDTGRKNAAGEALYEGSLFSPSMRYRWGIKAPEEVVFRFLADYGDGIVKSHEVPVILDGTIDYWLLHRLW